MGHGEINLETIMDQILAENAGQSIEEYRAEKTLRNRISEIAKGYIGKQSSEWPQIHFNWDVSAEGRRYSLDGASQKKFEKHYPEGFLLGQVVLAEFDRKLCHYSRRDEGEIWEVGFQDKLAFLIVYLSENRKISPPLVKPLETGEVIFNGGHHRYAIAKEIGEKELPIYVQPKYKSEIEAILNIEWKNA
ncbi:hypothetical protein A1356_16770 [Methylomonas koyamae]|uniref:ParB/Sulfiredoxin domain-containing protein n=2 Tax=Methylomonas koyamae TaxID=702114 RepID=A0AA91DAN8_9GAMM|nr:hypothetical protein A1356_16770 [Methylomonas koyamae]